MGLLQLSFMCVGAVLTAGGAVIREMGAYYFARDLSWLPCSDVLLSHPTAAIVAGVVIFAAGTRLSDPSGAR